MNMKHLKAVRELRDPAHYRQMLDSEVGGVGRDGHPLLGNGHDCEPCRTRHLEFYETVWEEIRPRHAVIVLLQLDRHALHALECLRLRCILRAPHFARSTPLRGEMLLELIVDELAILATGGTDIGYRLGARALEDHENGLVGQASLRKERHGY